MNNINPFPFTVESMPDRYFELWIRRFPPDVQAGLRQRRAEGQAFINQQVQRHYAYMRKLVPPLEKTKPGILRASRRRPPADAA